MSRSPLRVVVIGPFPPIKGGISHHTARVADACERAGMDVQRISWASQYPGRLYGRSQVDSAAALTPGVRWLLRWWDPISWIRAAVGLRRADLVVLPWVTPVHALPQLLWLLAARRGARVVHVHNAVPHEPMVGATALTRLVLGRADLLVSHARSIERELASLGIETPVRVVAHPPNLELEPSPLPPRPPLRLLCIGTIRAYKGVPTAVAAADLLAAEGVAVVLTIAGEVWDGAEAPGQDDRTTDQAELDLRYGYVSDSDMASLLADHHLVLAPYRSATQSGVIPLAFAAGRPVVATDVGGLPDLVLEGHNGALSPPDDPAALAAAVKRVLPVLETCAAGAGRSASSWDDYAALLAGHVNG